VVGDVSVIIFNVVVVASAFVGAVDGAIVVVAVVVLEELGAGTSHGGIGFFADASSGCTTDCGDVDGDVDVDGPLPPRRFPPECSEVWCEE